MTQPTLGSKANPFGSVQQAQAHGFSFMAHSTETGPNGAPLALVRMSVLRGELHFLCGFAIDKTEAR